MPLRPPPANQPGAGVRTIPTPGTAKVSFADSTITYDGRTFPFTPLKQVAQELIVAGGAEALVQKRLASA